MLGFYALYGTWRLRLQLVGENVPVVDVIVTACGESLDVVQDTILAALSIDYPQQKFRVIVADDGRSLELKSWIAESGRSNLYYTCRTTREGFKGGNLNHAVKESELLPGKPAEFIASLDADMIAEKRWLRSILPHLILDKRLGLVCPTQVVHFTSVSLQTSIRILTYLA